MFLVYNRFDSCIACLSNLANAARILMDAEGTTVRYHAELVGEQEWVDSNLYGGWPF